MNEQAKPQEEDSGPLLSGDLTKMIEPGIFRKLSSEMRNAGKLATTSEIAFLVSLYYTFQKQRMRMNNKIKASEREAEKAAVGDPEKEGSIPQPVILSEFFHQNFYAMERLVIKPLEAFIKEDDVGKWMLSLTGMGPVLTAGFLSILDITKAKAAPSFWRFAGLDPTLVWEKGQKRPYNAKLRTLCYKFAVTMVMNSNREDCFYGQYYRDVKADLTRRNEAGEFAEKARGILELMEKHRRKSAKAAEEDERNLSPDLGEDGFESGDETESEHYEPEAESSSDAKKALASGKLFKKAIDNRARRMMSKLFLSHLFTVMFEVRNGYRAPEPYVIEHLGHVDYIPPPNYEQLPRNASNHYPMLKNDGHRA